MSTYEQVHKEDGGPSAWPRRIRLLHWSVFTVLLVGISAIVFRDWIDEGSIRKTLLNLHWQAGLLILLLTLLRIPIRIKTERPGIAKRRAWADKAASALHGIFYALLLTLPLVGWAFVNAKGKDVSLLGIPLPVLTSRNRDLAETLQSFHTTAGWVLLALIAIHVAAALWHHWMIGDNTLRAMLGMRNPPALSPSPPENVSEEDA